MGGASITAENAPLPVEHRVARLEDRVTCLEAQGARVEERTVLILASVERIEDRVYQTHGDVRNQGGAQTENRHSRFVILKTSALIFAALAVGIAAVGVVISNL